MFKSRADSSAQSIRMLSGRAEGGSGGDRRRPSPSVASAPGTEAWVVGFGTVSAKGGGAGTKRQVSVLVNQLNKVAPGTIDVGDAEEAACHGDSGGPLYVHLKDGDRLQRRDAPDA